MQHNEYMIRVSCIFTILVQVALLGVEFNCYPLKYVKHLQRRISLTRQRRRFVALFRRASSLKTCRRLLSNVAVAAGGKTVPLY